MFLTNISCECLYVNTVTINPETETISYMDVIVILLMDVFLYLSTVIQIFSLNLYS